MPGKIKTFFRYVFRRPHSRHPSATPSSGATTDSTWINATPDSSLSRLASATRYVEYIDGLDMPMLDGEVVQVSDSVSQFDSKSLSSSEEEDFTEEEDEENSSDSHDTFFTAPQDIIESPLIVPTLHYASSPPNTQQIPRSDSIILLYRAMKTPRDTMSIRAQGRLRTKWTERSKGWRLVWAVLKPQEVLVFWDQERHPRRIPLTPTTILQLHSSLDFSLALKTPTHTHVFHFNTLSALHRWYWKLYDRLPFSTRPLPTHLCVHVVLSDTITHKVMLPFDPHISESEIIHSCLRVLLDHGFVNRADLFNAQFKVVLRRGDRLEWVSCSSRSSSDDVKPVGPWIVEQTHVIELRRWSGDISQVPTQLSHTTLTHRDKSIGRRHVTFFIDTCFLFFTSIRRHHDYCGFIHLADITQIITNHSSPFLTLYFPTGQTISLCAPTHEILLHWKQQLTQESMYYQQQSMIDAELKATIQQNNFAKQFYTTTRPENMVNSESTLYRLEASDRIWSPELFSPNLRGNVIFHGLLFQRYKRNRHFQPYYHILTHTHIYVFKKSKRNDYVHRRVRSIPLSPHVHVLAGALDPITSRPLRETKTGTGMSAPKLISEFITSDCVSECYFSIFIPDKVGFVSQWNGDTVADKVRTKGRVIAFRARYRLEAEQWVKCIDACIQRLALDNEK